MRYQLAESTYILGKFATGATVTMTLYNAATEAEVVLTDGTCNEIGSTGVFRWITSDITTPAVSRTEYLWVMSDGTESQYGKLVLGGYPDNIDAKISEIEVDNEAIAEATRIEMDANSTKLANLDVATSSRAIAGDEMDLIDAPNSTAITAIQNGLATLIEVTLLRDILINAHEINGDGGGTMYIYNGKTKSDPLLYKFELYDINGVRSYTNFLYLKRVDI